MIAPRSGAEGRQRLGVSVIGVGRWGRNLVRVFGSLERARLVSVCDVEATRLASLDVDADKTSEYAEVLSDPRVGAVVIATPPSLHADLAVAAFEAGKHVFVEKPMALTADDARRVLRAARLAHRRGMVGFVLHYHPGLEELGRWICSGVLGQVRRVVSVRLGPVPSDRDPGPWWSLGPHDVNIARFLVGREPSSVSLTTGQPRATDATDSACVTFTGCSTAELSGALNARLTFAGGSTAELSVGYGARAKVRRLLVAGTRATALFDDTRFDRNLTLLDVADDALAGLLRQGCDLADLSPKAVPELRWIEPLRAEAGHFVDGILEGSPFRTELADGVRVVEILEVGEHSFAQGGRPVPLEPEAPQRGVRMTPEREGTLRAEAGRV